MKNSQINKNLSGGVDKQSIFREKEWYMEKIVEIVDQIDDIWILNQIHKFAINMTKEGD